MNTIKQHILPKQANEITQKQFYSLFDELVLRNDWANYHHKKITIGKMIEILQTKEVKIILDNCIPSTIVDVKNNKEYCELEMCDALWEIIKDNI